MIYFAQGHHDEVSFLHSRVRQGEVGARAGKRFAVVGKAQEQVDVDDAVAVLPVDGLLGAPHDALDILRDCEELAGRERGAEGRDDVDKGIVGHEPHGRAVVGRGTAQQFPGPLAEQAEGGADIRVAVAQIGSYAEVGGHLFCLTATK